MAWNRKREAARAVFDALPLLVGAENVGVVSLTQRDDGEGDLEIARSTPTASRPSSVCSDSRHFCATISVGAAGYMSSYHYHASCSSPQLSSRWVPSRRGESRNPSRSPGS